SVRPFISRTSCEDNSVFNQAVESQSARVLYNVRSLFSAAPTVSLPFTITRHLKDASQHDAGTRNLFLKNIFRLRQEDALVLSTLRSVFPRARSSQNVITFVIEPLRHVRYPVARD